MSLPIVERLRAYSVPNSGSRDGQDFLDGVADMLEEAVEALQPLASKDTPKSPNGTNGGAYALRYGEIERAKALLAKIEGTKP